MFSTPTFTVQNTRYVSHVRTLRPDMDMGVQLENEAFHAQQRLHQCNLLSYNATCATRTTHGYFLKCLLAESARYQQRAYPSAVKQGCFPSTAALKGTVQAIDEACTAATIPGAVGSDL